MNTEVPHFCKIIYGIVIDCNVTKFWIQITCSTLLSNSNNKKKVIETNPLHLQVSSSTTFLFVYILMKFRGVI